MHESKNVRFSWSNCNYHRAEPSFRRIGRVFTEFTSISTARRCGAPSALVLTAYSEADDELMGRRVALSDLPRVEFGSIDECAGVVHRQHVAVLRFVRADLGNEQFFNFQFLTTHDSDKARNSDN